MNATQGGPGPPGWLNLPIRVPAKEARAGVIVVMNVLNLCRYLQVRDEHDHRATDIGLIVASGI